MLRIFLILFALWMKATIVMTAAVASVDAIEALDNDDFWKSGRVFQNVPEEQPLELTAHDAAEAYASYIASNSNLSPLSLKEIFELKRMLLSLSGQQLRNMYNSAKDNQNDLGLRVAEVMKAMLAKEMAIEHFKQRLINSIGSNVPLNYTESEARKLKSKLPAQLIQRVEKMVALEEREAQEEIGSASHISTSPRKELIVLGAEKLNELCPPGSRSGCYQFNVHEKSIRHYKVLRANLQLEVGPAWARNKIVEVFMLMSTGNKMVLGRHLTGRSGGVRLKNGRAHVDVTQVVKRWLLYQRHYAGLKQEENAPAHWQQLMIRCVDCPSFQTACPTAKNLVIEIFLRQNYDKELKRHQRRRRRHAPDNSGIEGACPSFDLGINMKCCTRNYETTAIDVGFNFVLAPSRIKLNYCDGNCNGINTPANAHAMMIQMILERNNDIPQSKKSAMNPCCSPTLMASQTMLFETVTQEVEMRKIANIGVMQCGCQ